MTTPEPLAQVQWRKSSFTGDGGANGSTCVEVAMLPEGRIAVRNSNHPDTGVVLVTRPEMNAWLRAIKAGELDDLS